MAHEWCHLTEIPTNVMINAIKIRVTNVGIEGALENLTL